MPEEQCLCMDECDNIWIITKLLHKQTGVEWELMNGGTIYELGYIPQFINPDSNDLIDEAIQRYQYGGYRMGGKVLENGEYAYPGDPNLKPVASCQPTPSIKIYVYRYGIITFITDGKYEEARTYRFD